MDWLDLLAVQGTFKSLLQHHSSKEQQGEIRKPTSVINAKKKRKTIEWERLESSSRKSNDNPVCETAKETEMY